MPRPVLQCSDASGTFHNFSKWVMELNIQHEELDDDESGRDTKTGRMKRNYIATKHTLSVKMVNHLPQEIAHEIRDTTRSSTGRTTLQVKWYSPCANDIVELEMYCSSVNYGAQRYNKVRDEVYYDGVSFNLIQV